MCGYGWGDPEAIETTRGQQSRPTAEQRITGSWRTENTDLIFENERDKVCCGKGKEKEGRLSCEVVVVSVVGKVGARERVL